MSELTNQPLQVLSYSSKQKLEQTTIRCIGVLGLIVSVPAIIRLFMEVCQLTLMRPPGWFMRFVELYNRQRLPTLEQYLPGFWSDALYPLLNEFVAIFLLAGAIGCLRKYPRARAWMIFYAIIQLSIIFIELLMQTYQRSNPRMYYYTEERSEYFIVDLMKYIHAAAWFSVYPILILWFMTRKYVREMYLQKFGDD